MKIFLTLWIVKTPYLMSGQYTYLALGDSYTIGEGLQLEQSWPYQLQKLLNEDGYHFCNPVIIAKTGWRTDELLQAIPKELKEKDTFDMVSLLIGVNNQYQNKPLDQYKTEFKKLLQEALRRSKHGTKTVFVVSIPDYSVTEFARSNHKTKAMLDLKKYNLYTEQLCIENNVKFYDITPLSTKQSKLYNMLIEDKLHPNENQYTIWVQSFYKSISNQLKNM